MPRTPRPRIAFTLPALAAMTAGALGLGAGAADAEVRRSISQPGTACLWAASAHPAGATVVAGGREFHCATDESGAPAWAAGQRSGRADTVANPGSAGDPTARFSPGARQPGTEYNDYCVGNQLIAGTEDVYQVVRANDGSLFWKAAEPISAWRFDLGTATPPPTSRTVSLCSEGNLM